MKDLYRVFRHTMSALFIAFLIMWPGLLQAEHLTGQCGLHGTTFNIGSFNDVGMGAGVSTGKRTGNCSYGVFFLKVTDASNADEKSLDVWVQTSPDSGTTWHDVARFANVTGISGTGGGQLAYWDAGGILDGTTDEEVAIASKSISAGVVTQGPMGNRIRVAYNLLSVTAAWDFSVLAVMGR